MCLILVAHNVMADMQLLFVSNRDERYDRPAAPASFWQDRPWILGGRDLEAGGTWLAVSGGGQLAAITNIREPGREVEHAPSRGDLPVEFLDRKDSIDEYLARSSDFSRYNGFNLVLWDGERLVAVSNRLSAVMSLGAGVHGISNGQAGTDWPKIRTGIGRLSDCIEKGDTSDEAILEIMRSRMPEPDDQLPDTGVGIELERVLSSAFIMADGYGTRCTSIIRIRDNKQIVFDEYSYSRFGEIVKHKHFER